MNLLEQRPQSLLEQGSQNSFSQNSRFWDMPGKRKIKAGVRNRKRDFCVFVRARVSEFSDPVPAGVSGEQKFQKTGGFTLVEVVLAIAILAIISVPLINYFSQSMGYNTLMASRQHATHLAQEVAEELKEQECLVQPTDDEHTEYTIPYLTEKSYKEQIVASVTGDDGNYNWEAVYTGYASDIDKNYDVVVTASATEPASDSENGEVYGMDASTDVLVDDTGADNEALIYFKAVNTSYCNNNSGTEKLDNDQILSKMKREIDIAIAQSGTMYTVDVTYCYTCTGLRGADDEDEYEINVLVDELQQGLKNIYLLYHPLESQDQVVVSLSNCDGQGMGLYLACQEYEESANEFVGYKIIVTGSEFMTIYSNVGTVNVDGTDRVPEPLTGEFNPLRVVELQVDVYKKGETGSADPYITVHASKSE